MRAELDRLLESAAFRTSKRCREFLKHVVDRTITGPADTLKERSIGVELFQLPPDFDTSQHTVVRVTANEVRKKLAQQYVADNGSHHPVRIELPPGSYCTEFKWDETVDEAPVAQTPVAEPPALIEHPSEHPRARVGLLRVASIATAALVLVLIGAACMWWWSAPGKASASAKPAGIAASLPLNAALPDGDVRIIAGSTNAYVDRSGHTWVPDRFFSGGMVLARPSERILRTLDPDLYRHMRQGDFRYDIPLKPGSYEMHLHFAETGLADFISAESSGEGQRLFRVAVNGKRVLDAFDVVADAAGSNVSDERVFKDISPAEDGLLHLSFSSMRGSAMVSGIELLPAVTGKMRPIRIRAGWPASWQDATGQEWQSDDYFLGGNALVRTTNPAQAGGIATPDMAVYSSERWGHFSYSLPVAQGEYRITLKFCEGHYGRKNIGIGGAGSRVFDVYCNGVALLRNFDIFKEAGGEGRPLDRTFTAIRPTAQGKIVLTFVPVEGMACVNGIEVVED